MELIKKFPQLAKARNALRALVSPYSDSKLLHQEEHFLPNFCETPMVISVMVIAEMLAIVISLVMPVPSVFFDSYFSALLQISVFIQWIALSCAAGLCAARRYLVRLPNRRALIAAYALLLLITLVVNEIAVWVLWYAGKTPSLRPEWYAHMHLQNLTVSAIINALVLGYFLTKQELRHKTTSEARAKMQALQSRIRPHFVFNAMNIIASLTRTDPAKAEDAIEDMSELFRMMLNEEETMVPVNREIDVAKKYLSLEQLRLDNRLQVNWDIGKFPRKAIMPILTLQPLLENAIVKGIEPEPNGGVINIQLWEESDTIRIRISNSLPKTKRKRMSSTKEDALSTLNNVRQRFETHYGNRAEFAAGEEEGWFKVDMTLPIRD